MQWEYYRLATVESSLDDALQDLGLEGWELVSVMAETRLFHGFQCLLKRPLVVTGTERRVPRASDNRFPKLVTARDESSNGRPPLARQSPLVPSRG